jgi:hypothetical protein
LFLREPTTFLGLRDAQDNQTSIICTDSDNALSLIQKKGLSPATGLMAVNTTSFLGHTGGVASEDQRNNALDISYQTTICLCKVSIQTERVQLISATVASTEPRILVHVGCIDLEYPIKARW